MKYFGFLARYVITPLLIVRLLIWWDRRRGKQPPDSMRSWPEDLVLAGHAITAVAYTTAWDNYLVATNVWSYDPKLVTGIKIGYVPIEEYSFFVLQSLLTGSINQYLSRYIPSDEESSDPSSRIVLTGVLGVVWAGSMYGLLAGAEKYRYLSLILSWALPPIMIQTALGGDILWRNRRLIAASLFPVTAYLGYTDSLAITSGTWHITPEKTTRIEVIKNLPLEEQLFFFITNVLLVFGITLVQSRASEDRLPAMIRQQYNQLKSNALEK